MIKMIGWSTMWFFFFAFLFVGQFVVSICYFGQIFAHACRFHVCASLVSLFLSPIWLVFRFDLLIFFPSAVRCCLINAIITHAQHKHMSYEHDFDHLLFSSFRGNWLDTFLFFITFESFVSPNSNISCMWANLFMLITIFFGPWKREEKKKI